MKKEPLIELVKSLTMSEKRFFKIFSQRHIIGEENDYLKLFDFIDQTEEVDNSILQKQPFVKNVSAEKNYLYKLILKSLNSYYYDFSYKMKIQNYISNAEILAFKGLENQALKILQRANKLAQNTELFQLQLTVNLLQFEIHSKLTDYTKALESLKSIKGISERLESLFSSQKITTELYNKRKQKGNIRSQQEFDNINNLADNIEKKTDSKKEELYYRSLLIATLNSKREYNKQKQELFKIIDLYEQNDYLIEYSLKGYVSCLYNLANTFRQLGEHDKSIETLNLLNKLLESKLIGASRTMAAYIFFLNNNLRLLILILNNQFKEALLLINSITKDFENYKNHALKEVVYEHIVLTIRVLFEHKKYKKCIKYANLIIDDTVYKHRADILSYVRLFSLVVHFEKENNFSLDYFSQSTKNYLKRKNRLYKTENEVIKFLLSYHKGRTKKLEAINQNLIRLKSDSFEKPMFNLFDFQKWIESKIS